jgi:GntR family transcriptional regulator
MGTEWATRQDGLIVNSAPAAPLWLKVRQDLEERLRNGEFDARFPTDRELTDRYRVSRHTVRAAVRSMQDDGVVIRQRGRGSFLAAGVIEPRLGTAFSLFDTIEANGLRQRSVILDQRITTNPRAATLLEERPDSELFVLERIRLADGEPLAHDIVWIPAAIARPLVDVDFSATSLYQQLRQRCGAGPREGTERIRPVVASSEDGARLGLTPGEPALEIDRRTRFDGLPLEWRITMVRGDRCIFRADWSDASPVLTPRLVPR